MSLVDYPDSDSATSSQADPVADGATSDGEQPAGGKGQARPGSPNGKRKQTCPSPALTPKLPSLPSEFHCLYASNVRISNQDDPSLHSGRTRHIPHVEGQWPSHVYLEWYPSVTELKILRRITTAAKETHESRRKHDTSFQVHSLLETELGVLMPLHISLSASLSLQTEQKSIFLDEMTQAIRKSRLQGFHATPTTLRWVSNFDEDRWFLVLGMGRRSDTPLNRLLGICNYTAAHLGQPTLYEDDGEGFEQPPDAKRPKGGPKEGRRQDTDRKSCFHISIAWTLEDPGDDDLCDSEIEEMDVFFEAVKLKIGNTVHDVPLA